MLEIKKYSEDLYDKWNAFVKTSNNGTIFHRLDFLAYHGDKFKHNEHHLVWYNGSTIFAVMPMGIFEKNGKRIAKSPYGASYGGPVTSLPLTYNRSRELVQSLVDYLKNDKIDELILTLPISICSTNYSETFVLALSEAGFKTINSDISSVVPLGRLDIEKDVFTTRARNISKKACQSNIKIFFRAPVKDFWGVLSKTFAKHNASPTHSLDEWNWLCTNLPDDVWCDIACLGNKPIAGIGHFKINSHLDSSFYLVGDPSHQKVNAPTLLLYKSILDSKKSDYKYFDFGTSSVDGVGRENIFQFKESFGAIGLFRNSYQLNFS